jgi:predicted acylesterase/phospholipase RssA
VIDKERFLADSRQAYGRSALLLSGGASRGMRHWGVVKCLVKHDLLPTVICGASIGAIFAALIGIHNDRSLAAVLADPTLIDFSAFSEVSGSSWLRRVKRLLKHGVLMDITKVLEWCRSNFGDVTFQEAYDMTKRNINIVLPHAPKGVPKLLNRLTTPNVLLWSAAGASCAHPLMYNRVDLLAKDFDGKHVRLSSAGTGNTSARHDGYYRDLPMERLATFFNINHFIVSQVNPHVIPLLRSRHSSARNTWAHRVAMLVGREVLHCAQLAVSAGYWPRALTWIEDSLLQTYSGHITIVPSISLSHLGHLFKNPSAEELRWAATEGERATYPHLHTIFLRMQLEWRVHAAVLAVRRQRPDCSARFRNAIAFTGYYRPRAASSGPSYRPDQLGDESEDGGEDRGSGGASGRNCNRSGGGSSGSSGSGIGRRSQDAVTVATTAAITTAPAASASVVDGRKPLSSPTPPGWQQRRAPGPPVSPPATGSSDQLMAPSSAAGGSISPRTRVSATSAIMPAPEPGASGNTSASSEFLLEAKSIVTARTPYSPPARLGLSELAAPPHSSGQAARSLLRRLWPET